MRVSCDSHFVLPLGDQRNCEHDICWLPSTMDHESGGSYYPDARESSKVQLPGKL